MSKARLNLLVLRSKNVAAALEFYRAVGLAFVEEQHGSGPIHYSCELGGMVVEIYPGSDGAAPDRKVGGATTMGFSIKALDSTMATLEALKVEVVSGAKEGPWGRRAVVLDPDGRAIDLTEPNGT